MVNILCASYTLCIRTTIFKDKNVSSVSYAETLKIGSIVKYSISFKCS